MEGLLSVLEVPRRCRIGGGRLVSICHCLPLIGQAFPPPLIMLGGTGRFAVQLFSKIDYRLIEAQIPILRKGHGSDPYAKESE